MEYDIKVTQAELGLIYAGLGELPLKMTLDLFAKLQRTQQAQDAAKAVPIEELTKG